MSAHATMGDGTAERGPEQGPRRRWRLAVTVLAVLAVLPSTALASATGSTASGPTSASTYAAAGDASDDASEAGGATFDLDTGNAPVEVVIPRVIPAILQSVSPNASDAPLVLRITALVTNAWFDAIAPYHPTAVGVYSRIDRRPAEERATNRNENVAALYASYRVMNSLLPQHAADWRAMLADAGLDPDDDSRDTTTAVGIGNTAGAAIVAVREHDGMNQLGDLGAHDEADGELERSYNRRPYADYLGYGPVNTAYELRHPSRWQPAIVTDGSGLFRVQQFVTPQLRVTLPYSYDDPDRFRTPRPWRSVPRGVRGREAYRAQADEVLVASAALTDEQKATAELFDNKLTSLGFSALFAAQSRGLSLAELVHYDFLANVAAFDAAIAIWNEKHRHDAVRPFSAIRHLYGDAPVTAWGGPGRGTVDDIPAGEWTSYLPVADHPEYPSGSAGFCAAHAQASRRFFDSDELGWSVPVPAGSSRIEPGVTPARDLVLSWATWSDFERDCGASRLWGGVHFSAAITAAQELTRPIGDLAYEFVRAHVDGTAAGEVDGAGGRPETGTAG